MACVTPNHCPAHTHSQTTKVKNEKRPSKDPCWDLWVIYATDEYVRDRNPACKPDSDCGRLSLLNIYEFIQTREGKGPLNVWTRNFGNDGCLL